jgi:hypothetical protein
MERFKQLSARNAFSAFLLAFSMFFFIGFAAAQTNTAAAKSSLRPWTGVWTFVDDATSKISTSPGTKSTVEIRLTPDNKGLEISRKVPNQPDVKDLLIPDGSRRPMTASNCSGWQSAKLIPEAGLIISSSEMNCKDKGFLATTNVKMILAADKMVDILALNAAGQTRLAARRLMLENDLASEVNSEPGYITVMDRMALAEPWNINTVIHLSKTMETQMLEAALLEKKARLDLTTESLRELKYAKTPKEIIDLLVALAYPDKFHIEKNGTVELRPWLDSSSSTAVVPMGLGGISYVPTINNYPGMFYNCYSMNGYYSGYAYSGYPGGCYSYYSPFWWDYPVYVPNTVFIGPGGGGSTGWTSGTGRLVAGTGYVQIEPHSTGRHAKLREGYSSPSYSISPSASGTSNPAPSYSGSSGSYSSGGSSSSPSGGYSGGSSSGGGSAATGGSSSGGGSASPGGYSSGSGGGGAVPR